MKVIETKVKMYQQGGPMGPEMAAPAAPEQQDPVLMIAQIFMQGLETQDCQLLAQGAQAFLELLNQAQGGGQPPVDAAPAEGGPMFKRGGKMVRKNKGCRK